jgi:hypothetical protein
MGNRLEQKYGVPPRIQILKRPDDPFTRQITRKLIQQGCGMLVPYYLSAPRLLGVLAADLCGQAFDILFPSQQPTIVAEGQPHGPTRGQPNYPRSPQQPSLPGPRQGPSPGNPQPGPGYVPQGPIGTRPQGPLHGPRQPHHPPEPQPHGPSPTPQPHGPRFPGTHGPVLPPVFNLHPRGRSQHQGYLDPLPHRFVGGGKWLNISAQEYADLVYFAAYLKQHGWFIGPGGLLVDEQGHLIDADPYKWPGIVGWEEAQLWAAYLKRFGYYPAGGSRRSGDNPVLRPLPGPTSVGPIGTRRPEK